MFYPITDRKITLNGIKYQLVNCPKGAKSAFCITIICTGVATAIYYSTKLTGKAITNTPIASEPYQDMTTFASVKGSL